MISHSIRWRIQAWHGLILLIVIGALCFAFHRLAWTNHLRRIDNTLLETEKQLMRAFFDQARPADLAARPPPDVLIRTLATERRLGVPPALASTYSDAAPGHSWFILSDPEGGIALRSPNSPAGYTPSAIPDGADEILLSRLHHREHHHRFRSGFTLVFGRDISPDLAESRHFALSLAAAGLALWLLGLLGGWWLAGRAIRPIRHITQTAVRIADGNLAERINIANTDNELDQLGLVLNQTFDRLQGAIERQRRFTSDASHELRTPVAILIAETQRILKRDRSPAEYRDALSVCADTAARMRHLIESLLLLARQENMDAPLLQSTTADLADLAREAVRPLSTLAEAHGLSLHADALSPAPAQVDPAMISLLVTNLVTNAIQHHHRPPSGGHIWLSTRTRRAPDGGTHALLTVRDDGPGISPEDLPHIFERFYRADKARTPASADTPHSGLGLAIAQTIAANHRGALTVNSAPGRGATFTLTLPASKQEIRHEPPVALPLRPTTP